MKKTLKVLLWIMAVILFPITVGLYFIWPGRIFKDRMTQNWNLFWWLIYILVAVPCVTFKITLYFWFLTMGFGMEGFSASVSRENVQPSEYRTGEDFHKLTGVEFPELEMVDSLFFQDGCLPSSWWNEYKFVVKGGLSDRFKKELERACVADPTHWSHTEGCISDYHYEIYPDHEPVDRSRGMCDRMVEISDGEMVTDWDGGFITVDVADDTVILRKGWVR